jgi:hypothetical protein
MAPRERVVKREVQPPQPQARVVESDAVEPPASPPVSTSRRVVEREIIREEPDVL